MSKKDLYTQIEIRHINDENRMTYLSDLRAAGVTVVLLSGTELFEEGREKDEMFAHIAQEISFFKKEGFRVAFWTNSLGYGIPRSPLFDKRFGHSYRLTEFGGGTCTAVCTTDPAFTDHCREVTRSLIRASANMILWDDDLVQSVRPGFACVCPGHLRLLEKKTGQKYTPDAIRDSFTGGPNPLRTAFMDVMGESMTDFCRALREAADEVDPDVPMGLCASYTHYDLEGAELDDLLRVLAGKGKPFLRISGAAYWPPYAPRYPGQDLGGVMEFCRMQVGWLREHIRTGDMTLIDENDPAPRDHTIVPAALCELYDAVLCANGSIDRHKYMLCYGPDRGDTAYLEAHIANAADYDALEEMFEGTSPVGVHVLHPMHVIRDAVLPTPYCGNFPLMAMFSHPMAGIYLSLAGIPTSYDTPTDNLPGTVSMPGMEPMPGIAFGMDALGLTEAQMKRGVLLDRPAAHLLADRGIDVGPLPADRDFPTAPYVNAAGQRFAVLPVDGAALSYARTPDGTADWSEAVQDSLAALIQAFAGEQPVVRLSGSHGIYVLPTRRTDDPRTMSVLLCNMCTTDVRDIRLVFHAPVRVTGTLRCGASVDENVLSVPSLTGYDFAAVTVELRE